MGGGIDWLTADTIVGNLWTR